MSNRGGHKTLPKGTPKWVQKGPVILGDQGTGLGGVPGIQGDPKSFPLPSQAIMSSGVPVNVEARNFEGQQICGGQEWWRGLGWVSDFGVGVILGKPLFGWDQGEFI